MITFAKSMRPPLVTLLTTKQHTLDKGAANGWAPCVIQVEPGNGAGLGSVCTSAGICEIIDCLAGAGRNAFATAKEARFKRTLLFRRFTSQFFEQVSAELTLWAIQRRAQGLKLCCRPNV